MTDINAHATNNSSAKQEELTEAEQQEWNGFILDNLLGMD